MNWKATVVLVVGVVIVGIVAYINPFEDEEDAAIKPPWFYQVSMDDINRIKVSTTESTQSFHMDEDEAWVFDTPVGIPPSQTRWGGIVLLVSGPKTKRDFSEVRTIIEDPAEYGLDQPGLIVEVGLTAGRSVEFRLGAATPDGDFHYGQVSGFTQLFLIAASWGEVLRRIANEPPIPKWFVKRTPESIEEVNVYYGDAALAGTEYLSLQQQDGEWFAKKTPDDKVARPLDSDKFTEYTPLMTVPDNITVESARVEARDYTQWGIEEQGQAIEIRFAGLTERGVSFTDGVLFSLGDKSPDGKFYYATPVSDEYTTPIVLLDADWTDTLLGLVEDIPYGDDDSAGGSG
ncbi:MAG: DUF4340 domain-containing protein [SAR202 cluster bacterium]|jgi:hypothetical protein|nr:DUF4340 domain-containing protein [SAR202 cluster bacterium]MDP7103814.1 DUF4340 domain-containing protein [SAR202 cluster bacterium]MDP7225328.1 DUF4340 domain-containing protein [SAR202 cluster bacterium]MDP7413537.1 DUF4340 domain-containing protein [SAR202 cluster bacterium]